VALHRLASITIGVPSVEDTCLYYAEFGLTRDGTTFSTRDGGEQLRIAGRPTCRLIEMCIGADDPDDLDRVTERLTQLGITAQRVRSGISAIEVRRLKSRSALPHPAPAGALSFRLGQLGEADLLGLQIGVPEGGNFLLGQRSFPGT
jgi:hypothetical protein